MLTTNCAPDSSLASLHLLIQIHGQNSLALMRMMECLQHNAQFDWISQITVFKEQVKDAVALPKVEYHDISMRLSFAQLLQASNRFSIHTNTHMAIANADIFLSEDIPVALNKLTLNNSVIALTRRELNGQFLFNPMHSQDIWIFKNHALPKHLYPNINTFQGVAGCEHIFAMGLYCAGYELWNPCLNTLVTHNDPLPKTEWGQRHDGAYLYLPSCESGAIETVKPSYEHGHSRAAIFE